MYIHKDKVFLQWDPVKGSANIFKHGVGFDEASTVFFDERKIIWIDGKHSNEEPRFILLGLSVTKRILFVVFTTRSSRNEKEIEYRRIISARVASKNERHHYCQRS
ncbi:MAG: BrnT family toxin [Bdellovibrio sp.]|nr:BrnT family toxin [Bdellovibrio sp.]